MMHLINETGNKYGRLTVVERFKSGWLCKCECGGRKVVRGTDLRLGRTRSCGCLLRESVHKPKSHGHYGATSPHRRLYGAWNAMRQRCHNPKQPHYARYGGRGIYVCQEWRDSFESFHRDMGNRPSPSHTLDRIDVNGPYSKENCRWVTWKEQQTNKRKRARLDQFTTEEILAELAKRRT